MMWDLGHPTQTTYLEYQGLLFCLALVMCIIFGLMELVMKRFQILPMFFPGMFSIREKKFYFFDIEVRDIHVGKKLRWESMMLARLAICVVLAYVWEHVVISSSTQVTQNFPLQECAAGYDCFISKIQVLTLLSRDVTPVDCSTPTLFPERVVITCIKFVPPTAQNWFTTLAIAHSQMQLTQKTFSLMVWGAGSYLWLRIASGCLSVLSLALFIGLFFGGVTTEFVASWLTFVMSLSLPCFLLIVYHCAGTFQRLQYAESLRVQASIEETLDSALADLSKRIGAHEDSDDMEEYHDAEGSLIKKRSTVLRKAKDAALQRLQNLRRGVIPRRSSHARSPREKQASQLVDDLSPAAMMLHQSSREDIALPPKVEIIGNVHDLENADDIGV